MSGDRPKEPAARSRRAVWRRRLVGLLVSVVLTLVLGEIAVRVAVARIDVEHSLYTADPHAGWITRPDLRLQIDHPDPPLHFVADTNSLGLRGTAEVAPRAPGETRVLVLGDSFAWGIGVESGETFPVLLERALRAETSRAVTVINGGMPSYGTTQELAFYRGHADELDPDVVVLAYYPNDDSDNMTRYVFADGFLWTDPVLFLGHPSFVVELVRNVVIGADGRRMIGSDGHKRSIEGIEALRRACAADGRELFVLQITPRESTRFRLERERERRYEPLGLRRSPEMLIEMRDAIEREPESPYLLEHHLAPRGHEITADVLTRALLERASALRTAGAP